MRDVKVFISSVRRGLETERDALPGLIAAIGHTPRRFEDFTAQPTPSREACVRGVQDADVYLLLIGAHYGTPLPDTGQSPTEEEWTAAGAAGKQRLVYRKLGVELEADQQAFLDRIGDYGSGVFYDTFTDVAELQIKVAGKVRELAEADGPLTFAPLGSPVAVRWLSDDRERRGGSWAERPVLEVHVVPPSHIARPSRIMASLRDSTPRALRAHPLVGHTAALEVHDDPGGMTVAVQHPQVGAWRDLLPSQLLGVRVDASGQTSAWASLPGDTLGAIIDPDRIPELIADLLRIIGSTRTIPPGQVAIAIGIDHATMLSIGSIAHGPRSSASMLTNEERIRVPPDELVSAAALDVGATEMGALLADSLIGTLRRSH